MSNSYNQSNLELYIKLKIIFIYDNIIEINNIMHKLYKKNFYYKEN